MTHPMLANKKDIKSHYEYDEIVVVWSLDKEKVMYMSKMLNMKIHDKGVEPTLFGDVTMVRKVVGVTELRKTWMKETNGLMKIL